MITYQCSRIDQEIIMSDCPAISFLLLVEHDMHFFGWGTMIKLDDALIYVVAKGPVHP